MELWHSWLTYLVTCKRSVEKKGSQNKPIQINFKFKKTYQFSISNTIHKRFDIHHRNLILKSKSFDLYHRLATKITMRTSNHFIPERNLVSKSISFVLYQRRVTIENMLEQPWSSWHEIKEKIDSKIEKAMICIKGYHSKWPCLPLATISDLEALDTFQRDIWF